MLHGSDIRLFLPDATATHYLGILLGRSLPAGSVLLLEGDLGSGKTTLVQGIGEGLGIEDAIVSPTFILLQEYLEGRIPLYHFDLYRLQSQEVEALHPDLYWSGLEYPPGLVAIEWADRLIQKPQDYLRLSLQLCPTAGRQAQLEFHGTVELTDVDFDPAWLLPLEEKNLDAE